MTQHSCRGIAECTTSISNCRAPWDARLRQMQDKRCFCLPLCSLSPALPSSSHPLFCLDGRQAPSCFSRGRRCVADLNVTAEGGKKRSAVGLLEIEGCGGSEPNKLCWEAELSLSLSLFSFSSSSPAPGGVLPASTCSPEMPLRLSWTISTCHVDYLPQHEAKGADM